MQKIHSAGTEHARYFWNVKMENGKAIEYRSRCASAKDVRKQFASSGKKVVSIKAAKA